MPSLLYNGYHFISGSNSKTIMKARACAYPLDIGLVMSKSTQMAHVGLVKVSNSTYASRSSLLFISNTAASIQCRRNSISDARRH